MRKRLFTPLLKSGTKTRLTELSSEIGELKVRNEFSIDVAKSIYSKISYPSNKGGFERNFIEFIDSIFSNLTLFVLGSLNIYPSSKLRVFGEACRYPAVTFFFSEDS